MFQRIILLIAIAFSATAQEASLSSKLDRAAEAYQKNRRFMGSVLVAKGDKVIHEKGYGLGEHRMEHSQFADHEVQARIDHQAVHRHRDPAASGAGQAQGHRSRVQVRRRLPGQMEGGHDSPTAFAHVRHSQLHRNPRILHAENSANSAIAG
jgi:hypothetical protein